MTTDTKVINDILALQPNAVRLVVLIAHLYQSSIIGNSFSFQQAYTAAGKRLDITEKTFANYLSSMVKSGILKRISKSEYRFGEGVLDYAIHIPSETDALQIKAFDYMPDEFFGLSQAQGLIVLALVEKTNTTNRFTYSKQVIAEFQAQDFSLKDIQSTMSYLKSNNCIKQVGSYRYMFNPRFIYVGANKSWEYHCYIYDKKEKHHIWQQ